MCALGKTVSPFLARPALFGVSLIMVSNAPGSLFLVLPAYAGIIKY